MKGILIRDDAVALLRNERDEWELPGGKLEPGESARECVAREIAEELGLEVEVLAEVDGWLYEIGPGLRVNIQTFGCSERSRADARLSDEHFEMRWVPVDEIHDLIMPDGYRRSIMRWTGVSADG